MNKWVGTILRGTVLEQSVKSSPQLTFVRWRKAKDIDIPLPGTGKAFRRIVHFPKDYTIQPLPVTNLGGRDPVSGRVVVKGIGGGIKHKFHWIDWQRVGPKEGPPITERVLQIIKDGCRTSDVALVGNGDKLRYILATENMKVGDTIKTSGTIPRIPVRANEGDAYPLGALPQGTVINCVEITPGRGGFFAHAAGTFATVLRKMSKEVVVLLPSKREVALDQECMAVVGRISNVNHNKTHIGSAQKNRELGNRPRSGLWHRKEGRHGRKIRRPPPVKSLKPLPPPSEPPIKLTLQEYISI